MEALWSDLQNKVKSGSAGKGEEKPGLELHPNDKKGNAYKKITLLQTGKEID